MISVFFISNISYAYYPPAVCVDNLQNEYEKMCFFTYNDYFIPKVEDCNKIYYLSRDIMLLKLVFRAEDDISFEMYLRKQYPHATKREYIQMLTYVNTINEILESSGCMGWVNSSWIDKLIIVIPNFFYQKCLDTAN
jgi:hypothetical protein